MGYIIEITTKNAVWDSIKTWGPPVFTLLLGLSIGSWRNRYRRKKEIQNIRSMIYRELNRIKTIAGYLDITNDVITTSIVAPGIERLLAKTPVYDAYIGQISKLKKDELDAIHKVYTTIVEKQAMFALNADKARREESFEDREVESMGRILQLIITETSEAIQNMEHHQEPWYRKLFRKKGNPVDES